MNLVYLFMRKKTAFSIVELAISIAIISLLIAGATAGQKMLRLSQLRGIISDITEVKRNLISFQTTYKYLPGDLPNAYDYWGASVGCANTLATSGGCNGDGNSKIEHTGENYRVWQHLEQAGLITGKFSGIHSSNAAVLGVNMPYTKIKGVGMMLRYDDIVSAGDNPNFDFYANSLDIGKETASLHIPGTNAFTPQETKKLDDKIDDGLPGSGSFYANSRTPNTGCIENSSGWKYKTSNPDIRCLIQVKIQEL